MTAHPKTSITDSPWYWVYLFSAAGVIALMIGAPKYAVRQAQIERNYEARQRAAQLVAGQQEEGLASPDANAGTKIPLWPLYVALLGIIAVAWVNLWRSKRRGTEREARGGPAP